MIKTHSSEETEAAGAHFAATLRGNETVAFFGDLGAGKTTFLKGMISALTGCSPSEITSPTFNYLNIYEGKIPVYHFDLYRIGVNDLLDIGYEEFFYGKGIAVIEWSERLGELMPEDHWHVKLAHKGENQRRITLSFRGAGLKARFAKTLGMLT